MSVTRRDAKIVRLLLASNSAARRAMLHAACVNFDLSKPQLDEEKVNADLRESGVGPHALAMALAEAKALSCPGAQDGLVLGCDQTLETCDGEALDKPQTPADAAGQLRRLSGRVHQLHSAAAIVEDGEVVWRAYESVNMQVRGLSDAFIRAYVDEEYESIRWSVGGYLIEGRGVQLFERIEGSHFAVLGLPLLPLLSYLRSRELLPN